MENKSKKVTWEEKVAERNNTLRVFSSLLKELNVPEPLLNYMMLVVDFYFSCVETQEMLKEIGCLNLHNQRD